MPVILDFERKVIFKEGIVRADTIRSAKDGKPMDGFRASIYFKDINYVDTSGNEQSAELHLSIFWSFQPSSTLSLLYRTIDEMYLYKGMIGHKIMLPVNPEPDFNDNSVYINDSHVPVDVLSIQGIKIANNQLVAELEIKFLGRFEESFQNVSMVKVVNLDIIQ
ncbi:hypothetical protein [Spirosoma endbachense]|uniref:Uncharacterized protein n=1 Tax=Spirosoma endbachense TaxID=2666025 RepID=A0A6P1W5X6_9BACT|nr:hypothetical protein [Spirosoma endbachense]QHV99439.1 hypothetical protein GJR95_32460 [Spirosoma endbachense]